MHGFKSTYKISKSLYKKVVELFTNNLLLKIKKINSKTSFCSCFNKNQTLFLNITNNKC